MTELPSPEGIEPEPTPFEEKRRQIIELNERELQRRIETDELDEEPYGPY